MVFAMVICEIHLPTARSLKEKRRVVKGLIERLHRRFRVSIAETDFHDLHQRAQIAMAAVDARPSRIEQLLQRLRDTAETSTKLWSCAGTSRSPRRGMSRRQQRVADLVRQHVSQILLRDMQDPRIRLASITSVRMTPDLKNAHIQVSVLGDDDEREETAHAPSARRPASFAPARFAAAQPEGHPTLSFELDRGAEHSQHISDLLEQLHDDSDGS